MRSFEEIIKGFKNKTLIETALTHRSWVNEHKKERTSNERLEFLGDAILEYVISKSLYEKFPDKEEGFLTALRAKLVNTISLYQIAEKLGVGKYLYLSKGEEETGGRKNPSLLADTVEAIIGAIYLDKNIEEASYFIEEFVLSNLEKVIKEPLKDPKSLFQEIIQAKGLPTPKYQVVKEVGPDHDKTFTVQVLVDSEVYAEGEGKSKSEAAQNAAKKALSRL